MGIALTVFAFLLILYSISRSRSRRRDREFQEQINKHGHRCYADALNAFEQHVVIELASKLNCREYFIFNNLILPTEHGSSEIDHVIVSQYGVFVIESKDYGGWIFGGQFDANWTQVFHSNSKKKIPNPIRQNFGHRKAVAAHTLCSEEKIQGVVVFSNRSQFRTVRPKAVLHLNELVPHIQSFKEPVLSYGAFVSIIGSLSYLCQATDISLEQHVANVQTIVQEKNYRRSRELLS